MGAQADLNGSGAVSRLVHAQVVGIGWLFHLVFNGTERSGCIIEKAQAHIGPGNVAVWKEAWPS